MIGCVKVEIQIVLTKISDKLLKSKKSLPNPMTIFLKSKERV
jgi:hypothetical protein